jgi:hypothetical protein
MASANSSLITLLSLLTSVAEFGQRLAGDGIGGARVQLAVRKLCRIADVINAVSAATQRNGDDMGDIVESKALFERRAERTSIDQDVQELKWPPLARLGLSTEQVARRASCIGGSDANLILSGDRERILALWREKRGEQSPIDLSANLSVMLGSWTEPFNRQWFEKITGRKIDGSNITLCCSTNAWRSCTLDGYLTETNTIWEAKHTNAFTKPEEVLERYMPQLQHNMAVARVQTAILSVIFGNHKFEVFEVASDWVYQIELLQAEIDFWDCVVTGREPIPAVAPAPPKPVGIREICLNGNNAWACASADWLEHRQSAKIHAAGLSIVNQPRFMPRPVQR